MVISAVEAHCPSSGLNVYVVVLNASKAGDQVPIIPLFETTCNGDPPGQTSFPSQTSSIWVNSGIVLGIITTVISAVEAHCPSPGSKV